MIPEELNSLDLGKLSSLKTLLESRSVSAAARTLGIPQPTLSHLLRQMRDVFADQLLVRSGNQMVLTSRGELIRSRLEGTIQSIVELARTTEFSPREVHDTFRIACTDFMAGLLMPGVVRRLSQESPGLRLAIESWGTRRTDSLKSPDLDLGIGTQARGSGGVYQAKLYSDEFVCITDRCNRRANNRLTKEQFAQLPHMQLSVKGVGGGVVDTALSDLGLSRQIQLSVSHFWLAAEFLAGTDLVLTAPRRLYHLLNERHDFLKLVRLPVTVPALTMHLFWHERSHADPAHAYLRRCIIDEANRLK